MTKPNAKALLAASFLLVANSVQGYHIDAAVPPGTGPDRLTANDWVLAGLAAAGPLCESEWGAGLGPGGTASDDANSVGQGVPGVGGLCATGRNDATGLLPHGEAVGSAALASRPTTPRTVWTKLDLCDATTYARNGAYGPYNAPSPPAPCAPAGSHQTVAFTATFGLIQCFVAAGEALVYDEWYAWSLYGGDGFYTSGDAAGVAHRGNGQRTDISLVDNRDAWHGHVLVTVDPSGVLQGSAETAAQAFPVSASPGLTNAANACGPSPACDPAGPPVCTSPHGPIVKGVRGGSGPF